MRLTFDGHQNCPADVGTGWRLVRRTTRGSYQATDRLAGTDTYGTASDDPQSGNDFSINFETAVPGYDEFLLATGLCNHWMVMSKDALTRSSGYWYPEDREVTRSHTSSTAYNVQVFRRLSAPEDPWVQYGYAHSQTTALYAGNNFTIINGEGILGSAIELARV